MGRLRIPLITAICSSVGTRFPAFDKAKITLVDTNLSSESSLGDALRFATSSNVHSGRRRLCCHENKLSTLTTLVNGFSVRIYSRSVSNTEPSRRLRGKAA